MFSVYIINDIFLIYQIIGCFVANLKINFLEGRETFEQEDSLKSIFKLSSQQLLIK